MPKNLRKNSAGNFWQELKRRKVVHAITVYGAVAFVILQLVDIVKEPLGLPKWTLAFVIVILCIGFIISIFTSWIYDITPSGVKKTKPVGEIKHIDHAVEEAANGWKIATFISVAMIFALLAYNFIIKRNLNSDPSKLEKSIAVLPFVNDSPNDSNIYFTDGIRSEILSHLQLVKDLRIISLTSVEQYRNSTKSIPEIGKEQNANYIVTGSVQKYGHSFDVKVQLIRAATEKQVWSESFDIEITGTEDIINVQSKIAQSIATELKATITPQVKQMIEKVHTTSLIAYDFYERGRDALPEFWIEVDDYAALKRAGQFYRKAIEFDSTFADAYVGLSEVLYGENKLDSVLILIDRALSYDDKLPEAYFVKGSYFQASGQKDDANKEFDKALSLNHNDWMAYYGKAKLYEWEDHVMFLDNLKKAISINCNGKDSPTIYRMIGGTLLETGFINIALSYFTRAFELDRDSSFYLSCLGGVEHDQGNYQKSQGYCLRALMNKPNYSEVIDRLAESYLFSGKYKESLEYYKKNNWSNPQTAFSYWQNGFRKEANNLFSKILKSCENSLTNGTYSNYTYRELAYVYSFTGDSDNAIKYLRLYCQVNNYELWRLTDLRDNPLWDNIRSEPDFRNIAEELNLKFQAEHERVGKWLKEQGMPEVL